MVGGATYLLEPEEYGHADFDGDGRVTWDDYNILSIFLDILDPDYDTRDAAIRRVHKVYGVADNDVFIVDGVVAIGDIQNVGGPPQEEFRLTLDKDDPSDTTDPDGGILAIGTYDPAGTATPPARTLDTTGAGTRLIWYPKRAAFRAGDVDGSQWDDDTSPNDNIGDYSVAMGSNTEASGDYSTAFGDDTTATGDISTALGTLTTAQAYASTVLGRCNIVSGTTNSWETDEPLFVIGNGTIAAGACSTNTNAVTVLKSGEMGIGTSTPNSHLEIRNDASAGAATLGLNLTDTTPSAEDLGEISFQGPDINSNLTDYAKIIGYSTVLTNNLEEGGMLFQTQAGDSGNLTDTMTVESGRVGIGTTNPRQALHVNDALQLEPQDGTQPTCDANTTGSLYVDNDTGGNIALCLCNGTSWTTFWYADIAHQCD